MSLQQGQILLCKLKSITPTEFASIAKFTKIKSIICPNTHKFIIHTITINTRFDKKNTITEDQLYSKFPLLLNNISRGFSIVTTVETPTDILTILEGPRKFSGRSIIDEDIDENDIDDETSIIDVNKIYDHSKIIYWAQQNQLQITQTEKLNGKYASFRIFSHMDKQYIIYGSKNFHLIEPVTEFERISASAKTFEFKTTGMSITDSIKYSIARNITSFLSPQCINLFNTGYTLVGELCDGQHFVSGDGWIYWFGAFINGKSIDNNITLPLLSKLNIPVVSHKIVYDNNNSPDVLDNIFAAAKCMNNEGCVLYCHNIATNEIILVKTKAIQYIVKRFFRQKIIGGFRNMYNIIERFIDAAKYHGLNTNASIRITKQLLTFGYWLMNNNYPGFVLNVIRDDRFHNGLLNGFAPYWDMYLNDNPIDHTEITITPTDFATDSNLFNPDAYKSAIMCNLTYQHKTVANMPIVVFFQSIQGSGKSFIADSICQYLNDTIGNGTAIRLEQDQYMGCTASTQGRLFHLIRYRNTYLFNSDNSSDSSDSSDSNNSNYLGDNINLKYVFISRCNANYKQYAQYLNICYEVGAPIKFINFEDSITSIGFMSSLYNIIHRSGGIYNINKLLLGYTQLRFVDVIKALYGNILTFEPHYTSYVVNLYKHSKSYLSVDLTFEIFNKTYSTQFDTIEGKKDNLYQYIYTFINTDYDRRSQILTEIRRPIIDIIHDIIDFINSPLKFAHPTHINYIGIFIDDKSREFLDIIVKQYWNKYNFNKYNKYIDHITVYHSSNGDKNFLCSDLPPTNTKCTFEIDTLIIRKSDGMSCITVKNITDDNGNIIKTVNNYPHITMYTPYGVSPMNSNNIIKKVMGNIADVEYICVDVANLNKLNKFMGILSSCGR